MNRSNDESDAGAPLPDFSASRAIQLQTIAPALGIQAAKPDYLDYDPKGRGIFTTMCANAGVAYLIGTSAGGVYGFRQGLAATPSSRLRVQVNSILNHCGRYGSRAGNAMGIYAIFYSLFEGMADKVSALSINLQNSDVSCFPWSPFWFPWNLIDLARTVSRSKVVWYRARGFWLTPLHAKNRKDVNHSFLPSRSHSGSLELIPCVSLSYFPSSRLFSII